MAAHQRGELNQTTCIQTMTASNKAQFFLNTKALNIIWGGAANSNRYWKTITIPNREGKDAEVVELVGVYWLELSGKIPLSRLNTGTKYKLTFSVRLRDGANGWNTYPVIFKLRSPGQTAVSAKKKLVELTRNSWTDVPDGGLLFTTPSSAAQSTQMLTFAMYEIECEEWKDGLIVEGVKIQPVA